MPTIADATEGGRPPRVAIAVPVHNGGAEFQRCLDSLARQTLRDIRVVIFENCSTDGSLDIARRFVENDRRFELRPSTALLPAVENFNRAISEAAPLATYFCLRAADDYSSDNFLEVLVGALERNPGKHLAVPQVIKVTAKGDMVPKSYGAAAAMLDDDAADKTAIRFPGSWYYGLYRSGAATDFLRSARSLFPYAWGGDRLVVYKMIADFGAVADETAILYCQVGSQSSARYKPRTVGEALARRLAYYRACLSMDAHRATSGTLATIRRRWTAWRLAGRHTGTSFKHLSKVLIRRAKLR